MSPEQAQGHTAGPASDIFSLGAVLGFAATGQGPFGSGDTAGLLYRVVHGKPDLSQVPGKLRPLLRRSLANAYWPAPYPGDTVITQRADAKCSEAFAAYAGVPDTHSKYGWDNIFPTPPTGATAAGNSSASRFIRRPVRQEARRSPDPSRVPAGNIHVCRRRCGDVAEPDVRCAVVVRVVVVTRGDADTVRQGGGRELPAVGVRG